jgi:tetratricopeptide (TPR) repeat protein
MKKLIALSVLIFVARCAGTQHAPEGKKDEVPQPTKPVQEFSFDQLQRGGPTAQIYEALLKRDIAKAEQILQKERPMLPQMEGDYLDVCVREAKGLVNFDKQDDVVKLAMQLQKKPNPYIEQHLLSRLVASGKEKFAVQMMTKLVKATRKQSHWATWMGMSYLRRGQWALAKYQFQRAISLEGDHAMAWYGLGLAFENERDLASADQAYAKAVELQPWIGTFHGRLASIRLQKQDVDGAAFHVDASRQLLPADDVTSNYIQGRLAQLRGQREDALKFFTMALKKNPAHLPSLVNSAKVLSGMENRFNDAKARLQMAIQLEKRPEEKKQLRVWYDRMAQDAENNRRVAGRKTAENPAPGGKDEDKDTTGE